MIRLIVAIDKKMGIASKGKQPWSLPSDEKYFAAQTKKFGGKILMGKKTFDVIGHILNGRDNIVVSRDTNLKIPGAQIIHDVEEYLARLSSDIWVIGGESIYSQTIKYADELFITRINKDFGCDHFFPKSLTQSPRPTNIVHPAFFTSFLSKTIPFRYALRHKTAENSLADTVLSGNRGIGSDSKFLGEEFELIYQSDLKQENGLTYKFEKYQRKASKSLQEK